MTKKCPKGFILRKSYITKKGTKVKENCIKSTSPFKGKRSNWQNKVILEKKKKSNIAQTKTGGPTLCPKGKILKKAYIRKAYTKKNGTKIAKKYVSSRCIKTNKSQKQINYIKKRDPIILKQGRLGKFGYKDLKNIGVRKRRQALKKAIGEYGSLSIMRKINVLMVFSRKNKELSNLYKSDKEWIYKNYDVKAR